METIAQEAKRLLEPIPEDDFIVESFSDQVSKCCAIGHFERSRSFDPSDFSIFNCGDFYHSDLRSRSEEFLCEKGYGGDISDVNNYTSKFYPQPTPKQRVIALLDDMINAGY